MNFLVFDTETSGFPGGEVQAHIMQLATKGGGQTRRGFLGGLLAGAMLHVMRPLSPSSPNNKEVGAPSLAQLDELDQALRQAVPNPAYAAAPYEVWFICSQEAYEELRRPGAYEAVQCGAVPIRFRT